MSDNLRQRYLNAAHAMQSGVRFDMESDNLPADANKSATDPKSLRTGVNSAMIETAALAHLLIEKGLITSDEYIKSLVKFMEQEVELYEQRLAIKLGHPVTLK